MYILFCNELVKCTTSQGGKHLHWHRQSSAHQHISTSTLVNCPIALLGALEVPFMIIIIVIIIMIIIIVTRAFREFIIPLKKAPLLPLSLSLPLPLPVLPQFYFLFIRKRREEFCLVLSLLAMN